LPSDQNGESDTHSETLDFNSVPKITGPVTWAIKKLLDHKYAAQLGINVLCDLSKTLRNVQMGARMLRQSITS
jgi:hypothetical protein